MRRATSSDGFLVGYIISVLWNFWLGLLTLALWALHYLLGLPLFFTFIGFGVWLLKALLTTALVYWAASSAADTTPKRENRNPYSAKDADLFGALQNPDTSANENNKHIAESATVYVDAWSELYDKMWEAASLIGVPKEFFTELMRQTVSGERDADYDPEHYNGVTSADVVYWFFDGLCEHRYLGYHNWNAPFSEIAKSLSESASLQGLPEIPDSLSTWRAGETVIETVGIAAMIYIASKMEEWCVFVIEDSSDWRMVGAVSRENAERFHAVINFCCELAGSGYKIGLLRKMDTLAEQTGEDEGSYHG